MKTIENHNKCYGDQVEIAGVIGLDPQPNPELTTIEGVIRSLKWQVSRLELGVAKLNQEAGGPSTSDFYTKGTVARWAWHAGRASALRLLLQDLERARALTPRDPDEDSELRALQELRDELSSLESKPASIG